MFENRINGHPVIGVLPAEGDLLVVLVDRGATCLDRYVVGLVRSLEDNEWSNGSYHTKILPAFLTMLVRTGELDVGRASALLGS